MSKVSKSEAEKLCAHYGDSEKTGEYDTHEVQTSDGKTVTMKEVRAALKDSPTKSKRK